MSRSPTYRVASNPSPAVPEDLAVLFAGESQTRPSHRVGPKISDYYLLHHVISGVGKFYLGDFEATLGVGDTFLIPPHQLASYESDERDPWRYRWVAFTGARADALIAEAGLGDGRFTVHTGANRQPGDRCRHIFEAFLARNRSATLEAAGHLHLLLAVLREHAEAGEGPSLRPASHREELAQQAISYLTAQYAEPVTIEGMAETLGYNRAYLSRLFKAHTGLSPATYLTKFRVEQSRRLLRERPELTVEQVASSVGFQDALYFSKQFKRWYGHSPTEYRTIIARIGRR